MTEVLLVLVAQIPLLIKLWMDYKSKKDFFRQEIYRKQVDAYQQLFTSLTRLQAVLHDIIEFHGYSSEDEEAKDVVRSFRKTVWERRKEWNKKFENFAYYLPTDLLKQALEYDSLVANLLLAGTESSRLKDKEDMSVAWDHIEQKYNALTNGMRIIAGIDSLSSEAFKLIMEQQEVSVLVEKRDNEWKSA